MLLRMIIAVAVIGLHGSASHAVMKGPPNPIFATELHQRTVTGQHVTVRLSPLDASTESGLNRFRYCLSCSPDSTVWVRCLTPFSSVCWIVGVTDTTSFSITYVDSSRTVLDRLEFNSVGPGWYDARPAWLKRPEPAQYGAVFVAGGDTLFSVGSVFKARMGE
jgi:hypothetical protein